MSLRGRLLRSLPLAISWPLAAESVDLQGTRFVEASRTALGVAVELRLHPPTTPARIEMLRDHLAVSFGVARVRVLSDPLRLDHVTVMLDSDISIGVVPYVSEYNPVGLPLDPLRAIPFGVDDNGETVAAPFYGQSILLGGNPGSGKSVAMRVLLSGLATSRNVRLVGVDPKHAELAMWSDRFDHLTLGNEVEPTVSLLEGLIAEVERRAQWMASMRTATLPPSLDNPWTVLVVDEWAELGAAGDTKQRNHVAGLLRRYVSLGRAVGCTALLCTQRPTSDAIDVGTRALITHRFALKCGDRYQAEAILGVGSYDPDQLRSAMPGRALWSSGGPATPVQFYEISDDQVPHLVCAPLRPNTERN
jgi:S-DNA-T family DNA segregation ATPase FtsK/SpoIIIE